MIEKIQHATASSPEGAKGLVKGVLACAFQNMAFMLPTGLLYLLVKDLLAGSTRKGLLPLHPRSVRFPHLYRAHCPELVRL